MAESTKPIKEARQRLARLAPDMLGSVDLAVLSGQSLAEIESAMIRNGCGDDAVQAARTYVSLKQES